MTSPLRKLEYIVPDAIASDADTLVTVGGVQSNRTRMVAAVADKMGMKAACWSVHTRQTSFVGFSTFQRAEICSASANMLLPKELSAFGTVLA